RRGRARARGRAAAVRRGDRRCRRARRRRAVPAHLHRLPRRGSGATRLRRGADGPRSVSERAMYVVDWLHKQALHHPDKPALVDSATGEARSYRQVDERASRFAELLAARWRLAPGARVAVLAGNSTDYLEMLYGCAKAGVVMVCLNWRLP